MSDNDIIIIGAGITGLSAAHALRKAGKTPIVLESTDRAGGRVRTVSYKGDTAEAGGQGIHTNYAEMYKLLDEYQLRGDLIPAPERTLYIDRKGRTRISRIKEDLALMLGPRGTADLLAFRNRFFSKAHPHPQFEIAVDIPEYDNVTAAEAFGGYSRPFQDFVLRPLTHAMANTTPEGTNLYYVVNGLKLALTTEISSLAGGNQRLLEAMAGRQDVRYGTKVDKLLTSGGRVDGVLLDNGETMKAEHVIVTAPAPIAGSFLADEFKPAKDFLESFPEAPLPLVFFFLDRPIDNGVSRYFGHPFRNDAAFNMGMNHAFKTPHLSPSGKAIISAWPTFPDTVELMKKSDEDLISHALTDMEVFVPGIKNWVEHAAVVRHSWGVARYPAGSVKKILDFKAYAQTLKGVSFAGTDYEFIHMEAGIQSAYRAVERCLKEI